MVKKFEELVIWQMARESTKAIYNIEFGRDYALANQIRRAAVSIMSNIAEGFERDGSQEFCQFLYIAKASCGEVRCQLYIAFDQGYIGTDVLNELGIRLKILSAKIAALIKHIKTSRLKGSKFRPVMNGNSFNEDLMKIYADCQKERS